MFDIQPAPFAFGRIDAKSEFANRSAERKRLVTNFINGVSTIIISPRRWGKSSLVKRVALDLNRTKRIKICQIDLYNIKKEEEFYELLAAEIIRATSSRINDFVAGVKQFLSRLVPKINIAGDLSQDISINMDWEQIATHPNDILDLAEKIALSKKIKLVVCIDEFQNIGKFKDPLAFQKKLRARWQHHEHVSYCLYGSKRHMMIDIFSSPSMPFYKFGDIICLEKITTNDWGKFISKRFRNTQKQISKSNAQLISTLVENHSYYTQQLAQQCWLRTSSQCTEDIIYDAFDSLTLQLSLLFQNLTDSLTNRQVSFLKALLNEEEQLSSVNVIKSYSLGTSANVIRIRRALESKEIIDTTEGYVMILDPMYKNWLKKHYFRIC